MMGFQAAFLSALLLVGFLDRYAIAAPWLSLTGKKLDVVYVGYQKDAFLAVFSDIAFLC